MTFSAWCSSHHLRSRCGTWMYKYANIGRRMKMSVYPQPALINTVYLQFHVTLMIPYRLKYQIATCILLGMAAVKEHCKNLESTANPKDYHWAVAERIPKTISWCMMTCTSWMNLIRDRLYIYVEKQEKYVILHASCVFLIVNTGPHLWTAASIWNYFMHDLIFQRLVLWSGC